MGVGLSEELTQKITTIESFQVQISHQESLIARMEAKEAKNLQQIALKEDLLEQTEKDLVAKICALTSTSVCLTDAQDEILDIRKKLDEKEEKLEILQVDHCKIMDNFNQLNASMEIKRAEYESNMQSNAKQVCELNSQLLQKDVDIEGLRNELESRRLEDRRENEQKISQLEENLRQKVAEMKEAQDKISCMNDDLETQIMDKMTAEEDNESLKANEKTLKDEIEELKMQKEELNQKLQKASEKERELSQDSEMSREALESLKLEMTSMEVEKNALRTELCGRDEELTQLKTNLKESQNAVETKNSQLEELRKTSEASRVENEQKTSEISKLTTCTESLKGDLKKSEDETKKMLEQADKDQVTIENLKAKLEAKEAELVQSLDALEQDLSQERDASKKEEIRLQSQIGLLEDKHSSLEKTIEETKEEHEQEKQKLEKKIEETQKKLKVMTEDRDSRIKRTRLLLDIQKKYEKQQNEAYEQYEELKKVSEDLKERVKDRDVLELDLIKYKNRTKELENEIENMANNAINSASSGATSEMPWDIDPELQDMSARELKAILGHDLTAREKIRLNEMVVVELEKDLKAAEANETRHIMDITSLKLELKKTTVKLNHLQNQRSKVKAAMDIEGEDSKSTKSDDRQALPPQTRKSTRFQDENASENNAKKLKLMAENENARSTRSRRSRASHLEKGMPDNPFTKNKTKKSSPLKTITNVNKA